MPTESQLTERARETRDRLLRTARVLFEQDGYDATSVSNIVQAAQLSRGTFYLYFESKEDVFRTLAAGIQDNLVLLQAWPRGSEPEQMVQGSISSFVSFYRENARMMAVLEQVATYDENFRALRRDMRRSVADRATRFVRRLQRDGVADPSLNARYAAIALTGMVDRFAYVWLVLDEDFDEDEAVTNLTRLWCQAIGVRLDGSSA